MTKKELELFELVVLSKFTSVEDITQARIDFIKKFIKGKGSQVLGKNSGKQLLTYPIKGFTVANSLQFLFLGNNDLVKQINIELQRDEFALRVISRMIPG